ncbi:MAG: hypothetical protein GOVbin2371_6 [Prokaryotic dsDNA virus sp.]|nr:hypothetical protein [Salipiger sp.]QDP47421.1 MAG: hypothetical protein GOVbin2371_6 [Prokaryotic dsDNA virus sp.]|tara:strand:- start:2681 stop:2884 length:204 start_codon:yes stop_codon:yes gene_type:complete
MSARSDEALNAVMERMRTAASPWDELSKIIDEHRQQTAAQGGDDFVLACAIAFFVGRIELPVKKGLK